MTRPCKAPDCLRDARTAIGYCVMHYKRWKRNGDLTLQRTHRAPFERCSHCQVLDTLTKGLCNPCYQRQKRHGSPERNRAPNGSGSINAGGYKILGKFGEREYEHRIKAKAKIGEVVHHKDHDRLNNELTNLEIFQSQSDHVQHHARERKLK